MNVLTQFVDRAILQMPFRASLLGFESDTLRLSEAGWRFSIEEGALDPSVFHSKVVRVIANHGHKMFMTGECAVSDMVMKQMAGQRALLEYLREAVIFRFTAYSQNIELVCYGAPVVSYTEIEPYAAMDMKTERVSVGSLFTPVNAFSANDIIIPPDRIPFVLEAVLKAQQPKQSEIRANVRKLEHARIITLQN